MHYNFAVEWLKAFRESPEKVVALYNDDEFVFEDVMLDQHNINDKGDLTRLFFLYANKDRANGFGVHNFKIRSYIGDERSGLIRWEWSPEDCAAFIGLDVAGKPFSTQGHTWHQYTPEGKIRRESSWWDASAILRQVGPVSPTKSLTNTKGAVGEAPSGFTPLSGMEHAQRWCEALGNDTALLGSLYSDWFTLEYTMVDDHLEDTITDREMLAEKLGGIAGGENGTYTFTPTEWLGDNERYGLIHWEVTIEGASTYRGLPTNGKTIQTIGSTFHEFDADGKIKLESTCWEDNRVLTELGVPIVRPHYWVEGFDFSTLG